jgi:hypothetical protein
VDGIRRIRSGFPPSRLWKFLLTLRNTRPNKCSGREAVSVPAGMSLRSDMPWRQLLLTAMEMIPRKILFPAQTTPL